MLFISVPAIAAVCGRMTPAVVRYEAIALAVFDFAAWSIDVSFVAHSRFSQTFDKGFASHHYRGGEITNDRHIGVAWAPSIDAILEVCLGNALHLRAAFTATMTVPSRDL